MKAVPTLLLCALCLILAFCTFTGAQTTTPTPTPSSWFECPERDGYFGHPYDCQKYFVCVSNNAWLLRCPANLWFDDVRLICDDPSLAHCTSTPTGASF